ncbi:hypothetical protein [Dickeya fangzhongdai]|uniref:Uncharacterized protein n=1 Tax=Dickeya fangzhongdai TaxID=1778540 RepID=A0A2K8QQI7_9GAMM|nr:hypothetical protein [Dickeya fangzhongdai]ATZ95325.1 hypothetical protein CVE23_15870 [Dickeya fangzhongdai]QOH48767.1 hypothetical protein DYD82_15940 [Dickeya fangzhongdai]QOH53071.1 hypothetical protein DYD83_15940 [Dickeya fangzhongdai]GGC04530.1 hypothetical protein GCM10007171_22040 [Dickeya fangzhongdai]
MITITYCNGFRLDGNPAHIADIVPIFEARREAARLAWEQYEQRKAELFEEDLTPEQYQDACRVIAEALGV